MSSKLFGICLASGSSVFFFNAKIDCIGVPIFEWPKIGLYHDHSLF